MKVDEGKVMRMRAMSGEGEEKRKGEEERGVFGERERAFP